MNSVDVVIPVHGRLDLLKECLDALPAAMGEQKFSVYVVNDNSPEGVAEVKKFMTSYPSYSLLHNSAISGFPRTVNKGAKNGTGNYVFLLNSDAVLDPGSVERAVAELKSPEVGVVGFKLRFPDKSLGSRPSGKIQHVGMSINIEGRPHHIFIGWALESPRVKRLYKVPAVTGAAFLTTRRLWKKFRGMDEVFGRGTYEDVDFCFKTRHLEGLEVVVCQDATGTHHAGASAEAVKAGFPLDWNHQIFYDRWKEKITWTDGELL